jgi:hypothetical protein
LAATFRVPKRLILRPTIFGGCKGSAMHKNGKNMSLRTMAGVVAAGLLTLAAPASAQNLLKSFFGSVGRALNAQCGSLRQSTRSPSRPFVSKV